MIEGEGEVENIDVRPSERKRKMLLEMGSMRFIGASIRSIGEWKHEPKARRGDAKTSIVW